MAKPADRRFKNKYSSAFSLIELLVIGTVLVLFSGVVLANYNNFNQQKNLEREISKLVDILSLSKSKAQNSDISFACSGSNEFAGYRVEMNVSDYNFKQCCRDAVSKINTSCSSALNTYTFPSTITNISGPLTIEFFPLSEGASDVGFTLKNSYVNKCSDISISSTGLINVSDIQAC